MNLRILILSAFLLPVLSIAAAATQTHAIAPTSVAAADPGGSDPVPPPPGPSV